MSPRDLDSGGGLSRFSLDRRVTVLVIFLSILVIGSIATTRIPLELIPSGFTGTFMSIRVPWSDAPAQEVLEKVTTPLEEEINTVKGIDRVVSVSVTGTSIVYLIFKQGVDMDVAYREVRDRIERAKIQFPDDIDRVLVSKEDASGIPIYAMGVAVDPEIADDYNMIQNEIILPLSRVDGVASVTANGLVEKEILIELDRDRTNAAGLNIYNLAQELGSDNFTMASGNVRDGSKKMLLRSVARFDDLDALNNRIVGANGTRLKDIATISYEQPETDFRVRAMSKPAVAVMVLKEGDANVSEVTARLDDVFEKIKQNPRIGATELTVFLNQGEIIRESLATLLGSGAVGGGIAMIVLFVFLRRTRLTLIIALGIPLSLVMALTSMYFFGETLNLITLLGLMICIGLLVDNSVVVAENIHRLYRDGHDRRDACINGAGEVALAITMSTLTTIIVFLPVSLVSGPGQFFLLRLAIPVCVSVAASLFVALVFIPLAVYVTLGGKRIDEATAPGAYQALRRVIHRAYEATFGKLNDGYSTLLNLFLRRRLELVLIVLAMFSSVFVISQQKLVEFRGVQEEEQSGFEIDVELPANTTLEETEEWFLSAEKVIEESAEELDLEGWFQFHRKDSGEIQGWIKTERTNKLKPKEIQEIIFDRLPRRPGLELTMGGNAETEDDSKESTYAVVLQGDDVAKLDEVAEELEPLLLSVDGVLGFKGRQDETPNEMALVVDRARAQRYGVNPEAIAGVVGYALRGTPLPKYRDGGKEIPVRVRFKEEDRESLAELADFLVPTGGEGDFIAVSSLTETAMLDAPQQIVRRDARVSKTMMLELKSDSEKETRRRLDSLMAGVDFPEGVTLGASAQRQGGDEDLAAMGMAGILSVIFIYLLMGFLFESFILPVSIILTIPLSAIGVFWIHLATGKDIDFLGVVAIILLVGVVVNNGIVLIDYVNRLRQEGLSRKEALLTATHRRFRPIMMTAITTIGGMIPLSLAGANSIGLSYTSFSLTLIGGMSTATMLTLLVVPVFYTFFDDARTRVAEVIGGMFKKPQQVDSDASSTAA